MFSKPGRGMSSSAACKNQVAKAKPTVFDPRVWFTDGIARILDCTITNRVLTPPLDADFGT